jgi:hypothetical protein
MYFKGTIVITDPCYIIKENPIKCPNEEDFGLSESINSNPFNDYSTPEELAYKAALDKYYKESRKYNDWNKCDYGENMEALGIHNYISESTIYGDWGCTTYQTEEEPKELLESILRVINNNLEDEEYGNDKLPIPDEGKVIGRFCAGLVGVFLLDEILAYNPDWKSWIEEHSWCATIIEGEVEYYIDKVNKEAHIVGTGNINFYTAQTSI